MPFASFRPLGVLLLLLAGFVSVLLFTTGSFASERENASRLAAIQPTKVGLEGVADVNSAVNTAPVLAAADPATSPNGFARPQCTWHCDLAADRAGWRLKFSQSSGRDAYRWPDLLVNKEMILNPSAGTIMVIDNKRSSSDSGGVTNGHVLWVTSVSGNTWSGTHSNWPLGSGPQTFTATWGGSGTVRINGGSTNYRCLGFLRPASSTGPQLPATAPNGQPIYPATFSGVVLKNIGGTANVRSGPGLGYAVIRQVPANTTVRFAGWTTGDSVRDAWTGRPDNRWFVYWTGDSWGYLASALVYGNP